MLQKEQKLWLFELKLKEAQGFQFTYYKDNNWKKAEYPPAQITDNTNAEQL